MSVSSYDAVAEKVLFDLDATIKKDSSINEFYIIPTLEEENKNSSPIVKGGNTLGLESWIVIHIYPYAHHQILQKNNYKIQHLSKLIPCLTGVALLNPEMPTVWNKRKELIISKKMVLDDELRLTRMALSRKPKCNDVLTHRKWLIMEVFKNVCDPLNLLKEELELSEMIANRYHSNYHAWNHRIWALQQLLPDQHYSNSKKNVRKNCFFLSLQREPSDFLHQSVTKMDLVNLTTCKISKIYLEELENNFNWISRHVSDHSGLHFRTFLISELLWFFKRFFEDSEKKFKVASCCRNENVQSSSFPAVLFNGKVSLTEFLSSCSNLSDDRFKTEITDYLLKLESGIHLVDVAFFFIAAELKSNYSLCLIFTDHEALWSYRKFLVTSCKTIINAIGHHKNNSPGPILVHQDKNGVPCRKDFKYDNENDLGDSCKLYSALRMVIIDGEEDFIRKARPKTEPSSGLIRNYSDWFKRCFVDDTIS